MLLQIVKDFDVLENVIKQFSDTVSQNSKLISVLILLVSADLIIVVLRVIADFRLKEKEKSIHSFSIKEKKRIAIIEKIYKELDDLLLEMDPAVMLSKVIELEKLVYKNQLYVNKSYREKIEEILDYVKGVMTSPRKKNYEIEIKMMDEFCRLFGK